MGIPLGILPQFWERPNNATSLELEQVNPITAAAGNRTQRLARHQAATQTGTDCPEEPGCAYHPS